MPPLMAGVRTQLWIIMKYFLLLLTTLFLIGNAYAKQVEVKTWSVNQDDIVCSADIPLDGSEVLVNNGSLPNNIVDLNKKAYKAALDTYSGDSPIVFKSLEVRSLTKLGVPNKSVLIFKYWIKGVYDELFACLSPNGDVWKIDFYTDV